MPRHRPKSTECKIPCSFLCASKYMCVQEYTHTAYVSLLFSHQVVSSSATPRTAARQASPSFTISWNLLKLMSIELMMPSNHHILCRPFLILPLIFPSIRSFPRSWLFTLGGQQYICINTYIFQNQILIYLLNIYWVSILCKILHSIDWHKQDWHSPWTTATVSLGHLSSVPTAAAVGEERGGRTSALR